MDTSPRDRITVDLQGLKGALMARAEADGVMPSEFVRRVLAASLGTFGALPARTSPPAPQQRPHRLCLRMRPEEVRAVVSSAARAGQRPGRWLARVVAGGAVCATAQQLDAHHATLVTMAAELAAIHRVIHRLMLQSRVEACTPNGEAVNQVVRDLRALLMSIATQTEARAPAGNATRRRVHPGSNKWSQS